MLAGKEDKARVGLLEILHIAVLLKHKIRSLQPKQTKEKKTMKEE